MDYTQDQFLNWIKDVYLKMFNDYSFTEVGPSGPKQEPSFRKDDDIVWSA